MLLDRGDHVFEVVEVEPGSDLDVGDDPLGRPVVDGPGADREATGEFLLFDQGGFDQWSGACEGFGSGEGLWVLIRNGYLHGYVYG